ncbi:MAG: radical SAM protein [Planctomycetaceae bacterium]|nr:radical SAM protein [Planctomycetaceae bacterium]
MQHLPKDNAIKYRFENFGGIIAGDQPPFLVFVDKNYMRQLGLDESVLWNAQDESIGRLSAPTEVHFAITNRCSVRCPHCYMDAGAPDEGELDTSSLMKALDILAQLNVFHIALGGGEALERDDLFEIAQYARRKGLIPNLTVSGANLTAAVAEKMTVFGQVNVSLDGVGSVYSAFRGKEMFSAADSALDALIQAGVSAGINCVVGKQNFEGIPELFEYAAKKKVNEIEFLRLKPSGRGRQKYFNERTTVLQNRALTPMLADLSDKFKIAAKIDCSFVPMFCYHRPPRELLQAMATYGCEAGNVLLGIRSNGKVAGCSFMQSSGHSVFDLATDPACRQDADRIAAWTHDAPEPCRSCDYLDICKGGCHAVSEFVTGDFNAADPDCPRVVDFRKDQP